jgi:hypothetical protein
MALQPALLKGVSDTVNGEAVNARGCRWCCPLPGSYLVLLLNRSSNRVNRTWEGIWYHVDGGGKVLTHTHKLEASSLYSPRLYPPSSHCPIPLNLLTRHSLFFFVNIVYMEATPSPAERSRAVHIINLILAHSSHCTLRKKTSKRNARVRSVFNMRDLRS